MSIACATGLLGIVGAGLAPTAGAAVIVDTSKASAVLTSGTLRVGVGVPTSGRVTVIATVDRVTARRIGAKGKGRRVTVARAVAPARRTRGGRRATLQLRTKGKVRLRVRKTKNLKIRLTVTFRPTRGKVMRATKSLNLRRGAPTAPKPGPKPAPTPPAGTSTPATGRADGTFKAGPGEVQRGYDLSFTLSGGGTQITNLVAHVLETCAGSSTSTTTTVGPGLSWAVGADGSFSERIKESSGGVTLYTTLAGRFTGPNTVEGTIRQESIVAGSICDTLTLTFKASR